jgi:hypothetical protein
MREAKIVVPDGVWVSIVGLYRPGRITTNQFNQATVTLESVAKPQPTFANEKPKTEVIRRFAPTVFDLKEALIREFGNRVSFSISDPQSASSRTKEVGKQLTPEDARRLPLNDVGAALREDREPTKSEIDNAWTILLRKFGQHVGGERRFAEEQEITLEMCLKEGIRKKVFEAIRNKVNQERAEAITAKHRADSLEVPEEQLEGIRQRNIGILKTRSGLARAFANKSDFFTWDNGSNYNLEQLYDYCQAHGYWPIPQIHEMEEACRYLDAHKHFAERTYKRSEAHLRPRPYSGEDLANSGVSQDEIVAAKTKLAVIYDRSAHGSRGTSPITLEKALAAGVSERVFNAILAETQGTRAEVLDASPEVIKQTMQNQRNAQKPQAPASNDKMSLEEARKLSDADLKRLATKDRKYGRIY